jgi:hypothetical protein
MSNHSVQELDKWEEALEVQIQIVQNCQDEKMIDSCMKCEYILDCLVRKEYIKAAYESMNKGTGGGFEF